MSLDLYFTVNHGKKTCQCNACGREYETNNIEEVLSVNITDNLNRMAKEAGVYDVLWKPSESGIVKAGDMVPALRAGLADLEARPDHFRQFNAQNGWGTYEYFVPFVREVLAAAIENPTAEVRASV